MNSAQVFSIPFHNFMPMVMQMAIAAVAHVFVFSAKPYHFLPASSAYGKVRKETIEADLEIEEGDKHKPAVFKETTTQVEAPTTSVTESVQDIVVEGGQRVSSTHNNTISCINITVNPFLSIMVIINSVYQKKPGSQRCCTDNKSSNRACGKRSDENSGNLPS